MSPEFVDDKMTLESAKLAHQAGQIDKAISLYQRFLQSNPRDAHAWYFLGIAEMHAKRFQESINAFQHALELEPSDPTLHTCLGDVLRLSGDMPASLHAYYAAYHLNSTSAEACNNLGATLQALCRLDEAILAYEQAVQLDPLRVEFISNLGLAYFATERYSEALAAHRQAFAIDPTNVTALYNQGNTLQRLYRPEEAAQAYELLLKMAPEHSDAYFNYMISLKTLKRDDEALAAAEMRYKLSPNVGNAAAVLLLGLQTICDWERVPELTRRVIHAVENDEPDGCLDPIAPFAFLALAEPTSAALQYRCGAKWLSKIERTAQSRNMETPTHRRRARPKRLRIGYLSEDFRMHPVAYAVAELFEAHDRERFEVFGYSYSADDGSKIRKRINQGFDCFRDIMLTNVPCAYQQIVDDQIDILVDLQGYTGESKTEIIVKRPAPIQVNFLGYAGSMAADFIDYIVVDDFVVPCGQERYFREKLVRMPYSYLIADSQHEIGEKTPTRAELGLPEDAIVFCSFNNSYKVTQSMFDLWMRVMRRIPKAVLWLREWGAKAKENLRREARNRGVDPSRIYFAPHVSNAEHAARHRVIDLFLDTFPYNAHATASLALRMGLPIVTLSGETFQSRVAGSLLHAMGFDHLITSSLKEYETKVVELASNLEALRTLRQQISQRAAGHPIFDGRNFTRNIEKAYDAMWQLFERGESPREIKIESPTIP
jgi:protein O-GlcNAc transferase